MFTSQYQRTCWIKAAVLAITIALSVAMLVWFFPELNRVSQFATGWLEDTLAFTAAVFEVFGNEVSYLILENWMQNEGQPLLVGVTFFFASFGFLVIPLGGRPIVDYLFSSTPEILTQDIELDEIYSLDPRASMKAGGTQFVARKAELQKLAAFAGGGADARPYYMSIIGREGYGKTRLALEWLKERRKHGWVYGVLRSSASVEDIRKTHFKDNTAILIDDPSKINDFQPKLAALLDKKTKLRILIADQVRLRISTDIQKQPAELLRQRDFGKILLSPMAPEELRSVSPQSSDAELLTAEGRPLYVLLTGKRKQELARRADRRLNLFDTANARRALAISSIAGPVPQDAIVPPIGLRLSKLERLFEGEDRQLLRLELPVLRPEPFSDEVLLRWMDESVEADWQDMVQMASTINPVAFERRLSSLWQRDLSGDFKAHRLWLQQQFDSLLPIRIERMYDTANSLIEETADTNIRITNASDPLQPVLDQLVALVEARPFDVLMRQSEAVAAANAINDYGEAGDFERVDYWFERIARIVSDNNFADDLEIRAAEARALANCIVHYSADHNFEKSILYEKRLKKLVETETLATIPDIRLSEARAASSVIDYYAAAGEFDHVGEWMERLEAVSALAQLNDDTEIPFIKVEAMRGLIHEYNVHDRYEDAQALMARLLTLTSGVKDDQIDHKVAEARALACMATHRDDDNEFEEWAMQLTQLTCLPENAKVAEIRRVEANFCVNAVIHYERYKNTNCLERWANRMLEISNTPEFDSDTEIKTSKARLSAIVHGHFLKMEDHENTGKWEAQISSMISDPRFSTVPEVRQAEAYVASRTMYFAGLNQDFKVVEAWGAKLVALADSTNFAANAEIHHLEAQAASNAIIHYGNAGLHGTERTDFWSSRLARVAGKFLWHSEIQQLASDLFIDPALDIDVNPIQKSAN